MSTSHEEHLLLELMEDDLVLEKITYTLALNDKTPVTENK